MLKTVEEVKQKYPGIRLSLTWDETKPVQLPHNWRFEDITGKTYNRVTVLEEFPFLTADKKGIWICKCSCKDHTIFITTGKSLRTGNCKSCGCAQVESVTQRNYKHGLSYRGHRARIYGIYRDMVRRCYDPHRDEYKLYGARGITVCDEWLGENGFENFVKWAYANGYIEEDKDLVPLKNRLSIDRIDPDGNYCPDNCRWIPRYQQVRNLRKSRHIIIAGITVTNGDILEKFQLDSNYIWSKINSGWSDNQILYSIFEDPKSGRRNKKDDHTLYHENHVDYGMIPAYDKLKPWSKDPAKRKFARQYLSEDTLNWLLDIKTQTKQ